MPASATTHSEVSSGLRPGATASWSVAALTFAVATWTALLPISSDRGLMAALGLVIVGGLVIAGEHLGRRWPAAQPVLVGAALLAVAALPLLVPEAFGLTLVVVLAGVAVMSVTWGGLVGGAALVAADVVLLVCELLLRPARSFGWNGAFGYAVVGAIMVITIWVVRSSQNRDHGRLGALDRAASAYTQAAYTDADTPDRERGVRAGLVALLGVDSFVGLDLGGDADFSDQVALLLDEARAQVSVVVAPEGLKRDADTLLVGLPVCLGSQLDACGALVIRVPADAPARDADRSLALVEAFLARIAPTLVEALERDVAPAGRPAPDVAALTSLSMTRPATTPPARPTGDVAPQARAEMLVGSVAGDSHVDASQDDDSSTDDGYGHGFGRGLMDASPLDAFDGSQDGSADGSFDEIGIADSIAPSAGGSITSPAASPPPRPPTLTPPSQAPTVPGLDRSVVARATSDLRTPLSSLASTVDALATGSDELTAEQRDELHALLARSTRRVSSWVISLLEDTLRGAEGSVSNHPVAVQHLLTEACEAAHAALVGVELRLLPSDLVAVVDEGLAVRALTNLLAEAATHVGAGAPIDVTARQVGDSVEVAVRGSGAGFASAVRAVEGGSSDQPVASGAGAVARLVDRWGGSVGVQGGDGGQTSVWFTLPLATPAQAAVVEVPRDLTASGLQRWTTLPDLETGDESPRSWSRRTPRQR